jgi:hypothetical protein
MLRLECGDEQVAQYGAESLIETGKKILKNEIFQ